MNEHQYRTPEETRAVEQQSAAIHKVLRQAARDGASLIVAMRLGEPQDVVERWVDTLWNGLRNNLSEQQPDRGSLLMEDRLAAIVLLLDKTMNDQADAVLKSIRDVTS